MDIRKAIKTRLKKTKVTQYALAQKVGISRQRVWAYLSGRNDLNGEVIGQMLDVLGLELKAKE